MGFAELIVIAIVGLIVVGPDRLPQTIKSGLVWMGRIKRLINETRTEFEQQLGVDEIRREIHNDEVMKSLQALKQAQLDAVKQVQEVEQDIDSARRSIKDDFAPEDDGLFGEQRGNHPPETPEVPKDNPATRTEDKD